MAVGIRAGHRRHSSVATRSELWISSSVVLLTNSTADFYFRQLWDGKRSAEVDQMSPKRLKNYARRCGGTFALGTPLISATCSGRVGPTWSVFGAVGPTARLTDDGFARNCSSRR